jgi:hypothetical protein
MKYLCSSSGWLLSKEGVARSLHAGKSANAILGLVFTGGGGGLYWFGGAGTYGMGVCTVALVGGSAIILTTGVRCCAGDIALPEVVSCSAETVVGAVGPAWSCACCRAFA